MGNWRGAIDQIGDELFADLVGLRRHLHANPELSGEETETIQYLADWLLQEGIESRCTADACGLLVDLGADSGSERFALRADVDALQIHDEKQVSYRSQVDGVMHACGHDVHATILAGALAILNRLDESIGHRLGSLRGIFQPAEETCVGATQMIDTGAIDDVVGILTCHVDPYRATGKIGLRQGVIAAGCDELVVTITGKGGHAARPHHTNDPITAAAQFLNAVHIQVPRTTDGLDTVVLAFGQIMGGHQCNVIPETITIKGTLRTLKRETRDLALAKIRETAGGIGEVSNTAIDVRIGANTPAVVNDKDLTSLVQSVALGQLGDFAVELMDRPSMGGEDFAYYLKHVPGVLVRLGSRIHDQDVVGLHTKYFDVDEEVIRVGTKLMAATAVAWLVDR